MPYQGYPQMKTGQPFQGVPLIAQPAPGYPRFPPLTFPGRM